MSFISAFVKELQAVGLITSWALKIDGEWKTGFVDKDAMLKYWQEQIPDCQKQYIKEAIVYYATTGDVMHLDYRII